MTTRRKTMRRKSRRRRTGRTRDVKAEFNRHMRAVLDAMRKGFGTGGSFEDAVANLRRQLVMRGGDGVLTDVVCHLSEDGRSAMLSAEWSSDQPVCANFALPGPVTEREFDPEFYVAKAEATKH